MHERQRESSKEDRIANPALQYQQHRIEALAVMALIPCHHLIYHLQSGVLCRVSALRIARRRSVFLDSRSGRFLDVKIFEIIYEKYKWKHGYSTFWLTVIYYLSRMRWTCELFSFLQHDKIENIHPYTFSFGRRHLLRYNNVCGAHTYEPEQDGRAYRG